jgi:hypothetical protein
MDQNERAEERRAAGQASVTPVLVRAFVVIVKHNGRDCVSGEWSQ